jgi:hypothetical protein
MSLKEWEKLPENKSKVTYMEAEKMVAARIQFNISMLERAMGLTLENCARLQQTCKEKYKNKTKHQQTSKP